MAAGQPHFGNRPLSDCPWQAWFDGAAAPNPGPMGLGARLVGPDGQSRELSLRPGRSGCNNEAELLALEALLELALTLGVRHLVVRGDSDFVIRHLRGEASTAVPHLALLLQRVGARLDAFEAVQLLWVPRHRNNDADRLCRSALGLSTDPAPRPVSCTKSRTKSRSRRRS